MRMSLLILTCWIAFSTQPTLCQQCRAARFTATLDSGDSYSKSIGGGLSLWLTPVKDESGWVVSVTPRNDVGQDWTYPVTMPIRTGEGQYLANGWGELGVTKVRSGRRVQFVLSKDEFKQLSKMADQTLGSRDPSAAGEYLEALKRFPVGAVNITADKLLTESDGQRIRLARLQITVTTPKSFAGNPKLAWREVGCASLQ